MKLLVFALASLQVEAARRNPQTSFARQSALEAKLRLSPTFNPKCSEDDVDQGNLRIMRSRMRKKIKTEYLIFLVLEILYVT